MKRLIELGVFLGLSAALHAGIVVQMEPEGGVDGGGATGTDRVTLSAVPDALAALVERWDVAPEALDGVERSVAPDPPPSATAALRSAPEESAPRLTTPQSMAAAAAGTPPPDMPVEPAPLPRPAAGLTGPAPTLSGDPPTFESATLLSRPTAQATQPAARRAPPPPASPALRQHAAIPSPPEPVARASPLAVDRSQRPLLRPERAPTQAPARAAAEPVQPAAPQPARSAEGRGGATRGTTTPTPQPAPALTAAQQQSLLSRWGGQIMARIERSRPRVSGAGQVVVALRVARDGRLTGASVRRSSGNAALDQAALAAVQRAGRFPAAPAGLTEASYGFSLPIRFR